MSYFQKHLRNNQNVQNKKDISGNLGNVANKLKKINYQRIKNEQDHHKKSKIKEDNHHDSKRHTDRNSIKDKKINREPIRFATEVLASVDSTHGPMRNFLVQADNSMEEMLNSSMSHFQQFLKNRDQKAEQNSQLLAQNQELKLAVEELMLILRQKLDKALRRQESQLKGLMADYLQLITKLLSDKEQLTFTVQTLQSQLKSSKQAITSLQTQVQHLNSTHMQPNHYSSLQVQFHQPNHNNTELLTSQQHIKKKIQGLNTKIITLYQLLEHSQEEKSQLHEQIRRLQNQDNKYKMLEEQYEKKLAEKENQFEEIFVEYDKVMKEALNQKDTAIKRLNRMIQSRVGDSLIGSEIKKNCDL